MLKRKQLLNKTIAIAAALAVVSPIAASAAPLDTTTYTSQQTYEGFTTNYQFLDTCDTVYKDDALGDVPIYADKGGLPINAAKGTAMSDGLGGKAADDNYYKLSFGPVLQKEDGTTDDDSLARQYKCLTYGNKGDLDISNTTKDIYFTFDFYNPSSKPAFISVRDNLGTGNEQYNHIKDDGTIRYSKTDGVIGKYEFDKWNTLTVRYSNNGGADGTTFTKEIYLNGEFLSRLPYNVDSPAAGRGKMQLLFGCLKNDSEFYLDNIGAGLVADEKTTSSFVEAPVFTEGSKFSVDNDAKKISYQVGATVDDFLESLKNISDFGDGENIALLDASGNGVESLDAAVSVQFFYGDNEYTRTYTLGSYVSPDDKTWLNVDFDDDTTEVLSSIDGTTDADKNGFFTALANNSNDVVWANKSGNNKLATDKAAAAHGAEIIGGVLGRAADDKSLKLTLPRGGEQINYEWRNFAPMNTKASDFVIEFSVMLPTASTGVSITPIALYSSKAAGTGDSTRAFADSGFGAIVKNNAVDGTSIANKWTKITYHFTKFATVTNGAVDKDTGEYDVYVDGVKKSTIAHSAPNISNFQFRMVVSGSGDPAVVYFDDNKLYTFKDTKPYFLDDAAKGANYNASSTSYRLSGSTVFADNWDTVADAKAAFGIQSVISGSTVKADTENIAEGDKVTLKSKAGNIIYTYTLKEGTTYLVQNLPIYKTGDTYTFNDRIANGTGVEKNMRGFLAGYDSDGKLVGCALIKNRIGHTVLGVPAGGVSFGATGTFPGAVTVKAFIWDADTYAPLVDPITRIEEK